jgi:hypothetical protein
MSVTEIATRVPARRLLAALCVLAVVGLLLAPSVAGSDPISDRIGAVFAGGNGNGNGNAFGVGNNAGIGNANRRGAPAAVCRLLQVVMPPFVRQLLASFGVGPCASP